MGEGCVYRGSHNPTQGTEPQRSQNFWIPCVCPYRLTHSDQSFHGDQTGKLDERQVFIVSNMPPTYGMRGSSGQKKFTRRVCLMFMPFDLNRMMTQCTRSVCGTAKFHHFFFNEAIDCDKADSRNV